jgi:hypothetical protein
LGEKKKAKRSGRQRTEIVEHVLENEEKRKLWDHGLPSRERHLPSAHAKGFSDRMEQEDLSKPVKKKKYRPSDNIRLTAGASTVK